MVDPGILRKDLEALAFKLHRRMAGFPELDAVQSHVTAAKDGIEALVRRLNRGERAPRPQPAPVVQLSVDSPPTATALDQLDYKILQDIAKQHGVPHHKMRRERLIRHLQEKGVTHL